MNISVSLAFVTGLLSFLSPCVLPLIPGYIAVFTGVTTKELEIKDDNKSFLKLFISSLLFILGFSFIFILFAILINYFGRYIPRNILNIIGGVIVILFGLNIIGVFKIEFLQKTKKLNFSYDKFYIGSSFVIGMIFGLGWSPCVGPILGSILMYASVQESLNKAIFLLSAYCFGLGLPFLLISIFGVGLFLKFAQRVKRYYRMLEISSGSLIIIIGIFILLNRFWIK